MKHILVTIVVMTLKHWVTRIQCKRVNNGFSICLKIRLIAIDVCNRQETAINTTVDAIKSRYDNSITAAVGGPAPAPLYFIGSRADSGWLSIAFGHFADFPQRGDKIRWQSLYGHQMQDRRCRFYTITWHRSQCSHAPRTVKLSWLDRRTVVNSSINHGETASYHARLCSW
jgi:hypothetical protein